MEISLVAAPSSVAAHLVVPSGAPPLAFPSRNLGFNTGRQSSKTHPPSRGFPAQFPLQDCLNSLQRHRNVQVQLQIDRRHYFDESLRRQQEEEAREAEAEITCPVDCVREVRTYAEFERVLHEAELENTLVVVDFYNSSCGSCKYILPQFIKLCKRGCGEECPVEGDKGILFIKHNVRDDYDDLTDLARFYSIRTVPMFSFFVDGCRVEQFPTRDKLKLEQSVRSLLTRFFS